MIDPGDLASLGTLGLTIKGIEKLFDRIMDRIDRKNGNATVDGNAIAASEGRILAALAKVEGKVDHLAEDVKEHGQKIAVLEYVAKQRGPKSGSPFPETTPRRRGGDR